MSIKQINPEEDGPFPLKAPTLPTTEGLSEMFPLSETAADAVAASRQAIDHILSGRRAGMLLIAGPCAPKLADYNTTAREGAALADINRRQQFVFTLQRFAVWKPRSNPTASWNGPETRDPLNTYWQVQLLAQTNANVATEINMVEHETRYGHMLSAAWFGSRAAEDAELVEDVAALEPDRPLLIKNEVSGDIDQALKLIDRAQTLRAKAAGGLGGAAVRLIFRGGINYDNPDTWEKQYLKVHQETGGQFIVDSAHGSEQAHSEDFVKSEKGQEQALDHIIRLARDGYPPLGLMMEASDTKRLIDPNIEFATGLSKAKQLAVIKAAQLGVSLGPL